MGIRVHAREGQTVTGANELKQKYIDNLNSWHAFPLRMPPTVKIRPVGDAPTGNAIAK